MSFMQMGRPSKVRVGVRVGVRVRLGAVARLQSVLYLELDVDPMRPIDQSRNGIAPPRRYWTPPRLGLGLGFGGITSYDFTLHLL